MISKEVQQTIYEARRKDPALAAALDELEDALIGVLGSLEVILRLETPLNDTPEGQEFNAIHDSLRLVRSVTDSVFCAVSG